MKRLRANDSAATSVKVGYRQAFIPQAPTLLPRLGALLLYLRFYIALRLTTHQIKTQDLSTQRLGASQRALRKAQEKRKK